MLIRICRNARINRYNYMQAHTRSPRRSACKFALQIAQRKTRIEQNIFHFQQQFLFDFYIFALTN